MVNSAWSRRANAIAFEMRGKPFADVHEALKAVRDESESEPVRWMSTDAELERPARIISGGSPFSWR